MNLPDQLSEPAVLIIGAAVLLGLLWLTFGVRRRSHSRDTAQVIAAVQAERDVLRANHAVEIATLEGKLAEAQDRARKNMDAALRLKEAERQLEEMQTRVGAAEGEAAEAKALEADTTARIEALEAERDALSERVAAADKLAEQRDQARREIAEQSDLISRLRGDLQESMTKLAKAAGTEADGGGILEQLTAERDQARDEARRLNENVAELRREIEGLQARLADAGTGSDAETRLGAEVNALTEREARLSATIREREETIAELRQAISSGERVDHDEMVARLSQEIEAAREREKALQDQVSRLSHEADGLKSRLAGVERGDEESRTEVEKRDALLELRLQKIYELEAKLRDQHALLMRTQKRAEVAEESLSALSAQATEDGDEQGAPPEAGEASVPEAAERIEWLQTKLDQVREENSGLLSELDALRQAAEAGAADDGDVQAVADTGANQEAIAEAHARIEALEARNASLEAELEAARSAPQEAETSIDAAEVQALRRELRTLAERFLDASDVPDVAETAEPSLAERIRAFKAARQMQREG